MMKIRLILSPCLPVCRLLTMLLLGLTVTAPARADGTPAALDKPVPENVKDLREIQEQVKRVVSRVTPAVVGIHMGTSGGSGVIISKDGHVLTAGHISGKPDRPVTVILTDGRRVKGKTLGSNQGIDSGLIQITDPGEWPVVEMGDAASLKKGQWCLALGHPNGYRNGRLPPVRLGRVLSVNSFLIRTDCALVGGDSGGALFDLNGKVIGIHSRIGESIASNIHVPVDTYRSTWDRLVQGEVWGGRANEPYLGVLADVEAKECRIRSVERDSPAAKAGLQADDVVTRFNKQRVTSLEDLKNFLQKHKPGDEVSLEIQRGDELLTLKVVIGRMRGGRARENND
jgi:serine protease Do